jgi:type III restriction enzyme
VFIEPKGAHLMGRDKWKADFLKEIREKQEKIEIHTDTYLITAAPFYNYFSENEFKKEWDAVLQVHNL